MNTPLPRDVRLPAIGILTDTLGRDELEAVAESGERLWRLESEHAFDDVQVADLDGDGSDEIVIGYNGLGGLEVRDADGRRLWHVAELGNVWSVAAGDVTGDGRGEILVGIDESQTDNIFLLDGASSGPATVVSLISGSPKERLKATSTSSPPS